MLFYVIPDIKGRKRKMAKTLSCPFCGEKFLFDEPVFYFSEYQCKCGANLLVEVVIRIGENNEEI
jgi:predicted  nucleic acid-binding Zn ribbon protein